MAIGRRRVCAAPAARRPRSTLAVDAVGFSAARETFAPFDDDLRPLGTGHPVVRPARAAPGSCTSATPTSSAPAPESCSTPRAARPRSRGSSITRPVWSSRRGGSWRRATLVVAHLTGQVLTDETLASRTGLYGLDGRLGVIEPIAAASARAPGHDRRPAGRSGYRVRRARSALGGHRGARRRRPGVRGGGDRRRR